MTYLVFHRRLAFMVVTLAAIGWTETCAAAGAAIPMDGIDLQRRRPAYATAVVFLSYAAGKGSPGDSR